MIFSQQTKKSFYSFALWLSLSLNLLLAIMPSISANNFDAKYNIPTEGKASWLGERFQGKKTANGELFDMNDLTASHATLPFGTNVKVTSKRTGKSVVVRINNRSEVDTGRVIDLSKRAAEQIGLVEEGVGLVALDILPTSAKTRTIVTAPTNKAPASRPISNESGKFHIQYASFFDLDNAVSFKQAMDTRGIQTTVESLPDSSGRQAYKVFSAQRYNSREEAKQALAANYPQEGLIIPIKSAGGISHNNSAPQVNKASSTSKASTSTLPQTSSVNKMFEYGAQFGAFGTLEYAKDLQNKLMSQKGVRTIIHQFPDDDRKLFRVLTNRSFPTKEEAGKFLNDNGLSGVILTFITN